MSERYFRTLNAPENESLYEANKRFWDDYFWYGFVPGCAI